MESTNIKSSQIIYGCMGIGGAWDDVPISSSDRKKAFSALETALESGISCFDTADIYTLGKSEKVFGEFLDLHPNLRSKINIQTKAGILIGEGTLGSNRYNLSNEYLFSAIENSLKHLRTDYVDMFLVHRPDPLTSVGALAETLYDIKEKGFARAIGVSNMSVRQIEALQSSYPIKITANQVQFSLGHTLLLDDEVWLNQNETTDNSMAGMLSYCQSNAISLQAWSPLDQGRYLNRSKKINDKKIKTTQKLITKLAKKYETEPIAIQLAWILSIPAPIRPIIGTTNPKRIKAAAGSEQIILSREDWYDLWISCKGSPLP